MDEGFKLKQFHKFVALIDKILNLWPNMNQCINLDLYGKHKHKGKENTITVKVENAMTVTIILMAATTNEHCPILCAN